MYRLAGSDPQWAPHPQPNEPNDVGPYFCQRPRKESKRHIAGLRGRRRGRAPPTTTAMAVGTVPALIILLLFCLRTCLALYEDQVGLMDWFVVSSLPLPPFFLSDGSMLSFFFGGCSGNLLRR